MSELVKCFGDAVELVWRGWKLITPALALSAWLRIVRKPRRCVRVIQRFVGESVICQEVIVNVVIAVTTLCIDTVH